MTRKLISNRFKMSRSEVFRAQISVKCLKFLTFQKLLIPICNLIPLKTLMHSVSRHKLSEFNQNAFHRGVNLQRVAEESLLDLPNKQVKMCSIYLIVKSWSNLLNHTKSKWKQDKLLEGRRACSSRVCSIKVRILKNHYKT